MSNPLSLTFIFPSSDLLSDLSSLMDCMGKMWRVVPVLLLVFYLQHCAHGEPEVPCYFIFGDSLSDSGNNNKLVTLGRANFPPNGIDFPNGPTGRFCNGRTIVDVLGLSSPLSISKFVNTLIVGWYLSFSKACFPL